MKRPAWRDEPEPDPNNPSKSQVKRDYLELQEFALKILTIPLARYETLEIDERLSEAIADMRRMSNLPARRRQAQFIGKLLREVDLEPFRQAMIAAHPPRPPRKPTV